MNSMFHGASSFNGDISSWNVSRVTAMNSMFHGASSFNQPLNAWDVSRVTAMNSMFHGASSFNQPLNAWDVSRVTNMRTMFGDASSFNQDISSWDVSFVTDMSYMFQGADAFDQNLGNWYVVLDDTVISSRDETLAIRAQNAWLDGQNLVYLVDDGRFVVTDYAMLGVNRNDLPPKGVHPLTVTASGANLFGTDNSRTVRIDVDSTDSRMLSAPTDAGKITDHNVNLELDGARDIATFEASDGTNTNTYAAVAAWNDDGVQILKLTDGDTIRSNPAGAGKIGHTGFRELDGARSIAIFEVSDGTHTHTYAAVAARNGGGGVQILKLTDGDTIRSKPDHRRKYSRLRQLQA